jgi:hypothetical protein
MILPNRLCDLKITESLVFILNNLVVSHPARRRKDRTITDNPITSKLLLNNLGVTSILLKFVSSASGSVILKIILASMSFDSGEMTLAFDPIIPTSARIERISI